MREVSNANFGLLIAYILPGFVLLWGLEPYSPTLAVWLNPPQENAATIGGFLYGTIAAVGLGMLLSTIRWLIVDSILGRTGIRLPAVSFKALRESGEALDRLVDYYYRYYQCHANSLVASCLLIPLRWGSHGFRPFEVFLFLGIAVILWLGSRDTLRKYGAGLHDILGQ
ncbi:MAG: hypothetical protein ABJZ55_10870 [Fuerstiella sp.]